MKILAFALGALCFFYAYISYTGIDKDSQLPQYYFRPPQKKHLKLTFSGDLAFDEASVTDKKSHGRYTFSGVLTGRPRHLPTGTHYRCQLERFTVHNGNKQLIMDYSWSSEGDTHYATDPGWTEDVRRGIFEAFQIDYQTVVPSEDSSLLRQKIHFFLGEKGSVGEFLINNRLRAALHNAMRGSAGGLLIQQLIGRSKELPNLLPSKAVQEDRWYTSGHYLRPLTLQSNVQSRTGSVLHILSKGTGHDLTQDKTHHFTKSWLRNHKKSVDKESLSLRWDYDTDTQEIPKIGLSYQTLLSSSFLDKESRFFYGLELDLHLQYETHGQVEQVSTSNF